MVLKCLNQIYRLSTDVMFFTWSPFVWMKINWWQMRKDSVKWVGATYWIIAPPSGCFGLLTNASQPPWKSTHTRGALTGSDTSFRDKWNKMISSKLSGIAAEKQVTGTHHERGRLLSPIQCFLTGRREGLSQQTLPYIIILIIIIIINIIIIIISAGDCCGIWPTGDQTLFCLHTVYVQEWKQWWCEYKTWENNLEFLFHFSLHHREAKLGLLFRYTFVLVC